MSLDQLRLKIKWHPYCQRCASVDNLGDKNCGKCKKSVSQIRLFNRELERHDGHKSKAARHLDIDVRNFYRLIQTIPELRVKWHESRSRIGAEKPRPFDSTRQISNEFKIELDKLVLTEDFLREGISKQRFLINKIIWDEYFNNRDELSF